VILMSTVADNQSEWFRDALMDLPPTCTKITLTAIPPDTTHPPELLEATGSSNQRRYHRADVGGFSITAKGDFGQTEVSSHLLPP
jgi:cell cycle checkpoint protein